MKSVDDPLRGNRTQEYDAGARAQRTESIRDQRKNVRERKHRQDTVTGRELEEFNSALDFMNQVFEREFDAFGIACCAGGVDEDGRIIAGQSGKISIFDLRISNFSA